MLEEGIEDDIFTHDGCSFSQSHGCIGLEWGFVCLESTVVMESVSKFMRQGHHLVERTIKIGHNAAFFHSFDSHTISPTTFTRSLQSIDPLIFKGMAGKIGKFGGEAGEIA